jgi:hypothetical protein
VGAKPGASAQECPGSVVVVLREVKRMADDKGTVTSEGVQRYLQERKRGLTKAGIFYWVISRMQMGGVPMVGGAKLPAVADDPEIGLPKWLEGS